MRMNDTAKDARSLFHSSSNSFDNTNKNYQLIYHTNNSSSFENNSYKYNNILNLQQTVGNQAIQRLIKSGILQTKLKLSHPSDPYEQEADRIANQIMKNSNDSEPYQLIGSQDGKRIYRKCKACEQEEDEKNRMKISRKERIYAESDKPRLLEDAEKDISSTLNQSGYPLDLSTREFMESRFGYDFANVRIHTNEKAARSANLVNARALTIGNNIIFGKGMYDPSTLESKKLLAHELTHVVQQNKEFHNPLDPNKNFGINHNIEHQYLSDKIYSISESQTVQRECINGTWAFEFDGCSVPSVIANYILFADKDNPAGGKDTAFSNTAHTGPCDLHDKCYQTCGASKADCDRKLYSGMHDVCTHSHAPYHVRQKCLDYPELYWDGVHFGGHSAYNDRQAQVCTCKRSPKPPDIPPPPANYTTLTITITGFPLGSADFNKLPVTEHRKLDTIKSFMKINPNSTLNIIGHADQAAKSPVNNVKISQLRANNTRLALLRMGIPENRIDTVFGVGASECSMPGQQPTCRKVEILLLKPSY